MSNVTDFVPTASTAAKPRRSRKKSTAAATASAPAAAPVESRLRPEVEALLEAEGAEEPRTIEIVDAAAFLMEQGTVSGPEDDLPPLGTTHPREGTEAERAHALAQVSNERDALQAALDMSQRDFGIYVGSVTSAPVMYVQVLRHPATREVEVWWHPECDPLELLMAAAETIQRMRGGG